MEYENNHYIPQFLIKLFGERINVYDIKKESLSINENSKNIFCENKLYSVKLEKKFNRIETIFSDLLYKKILIDEEKIILKKEEINLIKKFLLLLQMRTPCSLNFGKDQINEKMKILGYTAKEIENETDEEYNFRTIQVILKANSVEDILKDENRTYDSIMWGQLYNSCYLTIWDSSESNEDFIITDTGMTCEHEPSKFSIPNNDEELEKNGYLLYNFKNCTNYVEKIIYHNEILHCKNVYANFYMYTISNKRMIGLINPFFKLYYDEYYIKRLNKIPDIWPSKISNNALKSNNVLYSKNRDSSQDQYIYEVKKLSLNDVIYINLLMLDRANNLIGFSNTNKVIRSINVYTLLQNQRKNYKPLKEQLINNGYNLPANNKYKNISSDFITFGFNLKDLKYIKFMIDEINKFKNSEKK